MKQHKKKNIKITLRELTLFAILGALTFAMKVALIPLPNIEPVSLMVMLFSVTFGWKCIYPIYTYVAMEFILWGINTWSIMYLYIWLILAGIAWLCRNNTNRIIWAVISGIFGLLFGAFCTPVCLVMGGPAYAFSWWISGIPFDLVHCAGNFVIALILFPVLRKPMENGYKKLMTISN